MTERPEAAHLASFSWRSALTISRHRFGNIHMKLMVRGAILTWALASLRELPAQTPALQKVGSMPVEGVAGEFDHLATDLVRHRLYLSAEDQKTVEVFDLTAQKHVASISLFSRPHGLVFLP